MFAQYTLELFKIMADKGFVVVDREQINKKITEETKYITLHKRDNSIHYVVFLFNIDEFDLDEYKKSKYDLMKNLNTDTIKMVCTNIFVINIFIGNNIPVIDNTIATAEKFIDQYHYEIYWNIREDNNKLIHNVSKNQPSDIIGLKKMMFKAFENYKKSENTNNDLSIRETINNVRINNPLKIVSRHTNITFLFIILCLVYFFAEEFLGSSTDVETLIELGALQKQLVLNQKEYYRLFSSMFMHAGYIHLIFNLLALSIFGTRVERYMGSLHFALIFLLGGLLGNVCTIALSSTVSVGASGGIFALIGVLYVISKKYSKSIDGLNASIFFMYILINIGFGFLMSNINNIAHLGGLILGVISGIVYNPVQKEKKEDRDVL